jgi:hypothetical protein
VTSEFRSSSSRSTSSWGDRRGFLLGGFRSVPSIRSVELSFDPDEEIVELVGTDAVGTPVGVALDRTAEFVESVSSRLNAARWDDLIVRSTCEKDRFALDTVGLSIDMGVSEIPMKGNDPVVFCRCFEQ